MQAARKDPAAARTAFEQALKVDPKYSQAAIELARLDLVEGKPADARRHLEQSIAANPSDIGALIALAGLERSQGNNEKAQRLLDQARTANTAALAPRLELGQLALERGDIALAQDVSVEAERIEAGNPRVWLLRAMVTAQANDAAELARYLDQLQAYLNQGPDDARSYWLPVGDLQRRAGRTELARGTLEHALTDSATEQNALVALIQLETSEGLTDKARSYLARLEKAGADPAICAVLDGDIALKSGKPDAAVDLYSKAAQRGSARGVAKLAETLAGQGEVDRAVSTLKTWLETNPDDQDAARQLASIELVSGDSRAAMAGYERLLSKEANDPVALNNLAWLYFEAKDPRAEATARKAVEAAPDNPEIGDTLGWILVHSDAPSATSEALTLLESAVKARPDNPSMLYHLAVAQQKAGRRREAAQSVQRALAVGPFAEREAVQQLSERLNGG